MQISFSLWISGCVGDTLLHYCVSLVFELDWNRDFS